MLHFKMSILLIPCSPSVCCKLLRLGLGAHLPHIYCLVLMQVVQDICESVNTGLRDWYVIA